MTNDDAQKLRERAAHYRELARSFPDPQTQRGLWQLAEELEARAAKAEAENEA